MSIEVMYAIDALGVMPDDHSYRSANDMWALLDVVYGPNNMRRSELIESAKGIKLSVRCDASKDLILRPAGKGVWFARDLCVALFDQFNRQFPAQYEAWLAKQRTAEAPSARVGGVSGEGTRPSVVLPVARMYTSPRLREGRRAVPPLVASNASASAELLYETMSSVGRSIMDRQSEIAGERTDSMALIHASVLDCLRRQDDLSRMLSAMEIRSGKVFHKQGAVHRDLRSLATAQGEYLSRLETSVERLVAMQTTGSDRLSMLESKVSVLMEMTRAYGSRDSEPRTMSAGGRDSPYRSDDYEYESTAEGEEPRIDSDE